MNKKSKKILGISFIAMCLAFGMTKKRKLEEEKVEVEETKKLKLEIYPQPQTLLYQTAQKVIKEFLQPKDEKEQKKLQADFGKKVNAEVQQYIKSIVNLPNAVGETLLHNAKNSWEVEQLLFLGAKSGIESKLLQYPLATMLMKANTKAAEAFMSVMGHTGQEFSADFAGYTPLHYALICDALNVVGNILENPENVEYIGINNLVGNLPKVTPLILAARYCPDALSLLVEKGAEIDKADQYGTTPLLFAAETQPKEVIELLLELDADINDLDWVGENILFYAVKENNDSLLDYLIEEKKVNINSFNTTGETPLAWVTYQLESDKSEYDKQRETIIKLIRLGANINNSLIRGKYGLLSFIIQHGVDFELIKFFIKHGADVNYIDKSDEQGYPLAYAIFENYIFGPERGNEIREKLNFNLINFLIEQGAKIMPYDRLVILESGNSDLINALWKAEVFQ